MSAVNDLQLRIGVAVDRHHVRSGGVFDEILHFVVARFGIEPLDVVVVLFSVEIDDRIDPVAVVFFDADRVLREMQAQVVVRRVIKPFAGHYDQLVVADEFAEQFAAPVGVQPTDFVVVPYVHAAEGRCAALLQYDLMDRVAREQVALRLPPFDRQFAEVQVDDQLFEPRPRFEVNLQDFGFAVRVDAHVQDIAFRRSFGDVVFAVARDSFDRATFHHHRPVAPVAVQHVVDRPFVVALEDTYIINVLREERLVRHFRDDVFAFLRDDDHVVDVRAVADELVLTHRRSDPEKSLFAVDIQLGVRHDHFRRFDRVETAQFGFPLAVFTVFIAYPRKVGDRVVDQVCQVVLHLLDLVLYVADVFVGFERIVARNADHSQFGQFDDVVERDFAP